MNEINLQRLKRGWNRLNLVKRISVPFSLKNPVYVFHHIPKCGGTSLIKILNKWFIVVHDYRKDWSNSHRSPINIKKLRSTHCLAGHWELPEVYLKERYPEVFYDDRYKVFTFLRDPLEHSLSLYRYEKENNQTDITDIEEHFTIRPNYIATILNADEKNYKEIIDRYFFVGILERMDKSITILSNLIRKKHYKIPWINKTKLDSNTNSEKLSKPKIDKFKEINKVDYLIYNYALKKLNAMINDPKY
ncbi:MAG: sulfotransferase family 2 domain-containing protein [Planctomycetia bacterium]|nr:sulfotransferase family 2 domain-containing protein [Planctomycetia bacterium]